MIKQSIVLCVQSIESGTITLTIHKADGTHQLFTLMSGDTLNIEYEVPSSPDELLEFKILDGA